GHLAHEAYPRRFPDVRPELLLEVTWRHTRQLAGIVDRPVPLEMLTVGGHGQRGCWRELADRVEGTERMGDVLKGQVGGDGARIDVPLYLRVLQQGADLRGEPEAGALPRREEALLSYTVAPGEEAASALV